MTNTAWFDLHAESKKQNNQTKPNLKQTHRHKKQTGECQKGGIGVDEISEED